MTKWFFRLLLPFFAQSLGLQAQPEIQRYLSVLPGYQSVLEEETRDAGSAEGTLGLSGGLLDESGMLSLTIWRLQTPKGLSLAADVLETQDSAGAYSLFNIWPHLFPSARWEALPVQVGCLRGDAEVIFWRAKYFLRIRLGDLAPPEADLIDLVEDFEQAIPFENLLPMTVSHLPEAERVPRSVRFHLGPISLSSDQDFPTPLLQDMGLNERIEIASARYEPGEDALFLIGYPTVALAREYFLRLQNRLQSYFSPKGVYMKRSGLMVCVFVGPEQRALAVLPRVEYSPTIQWLHDNRPDRARRETMTFFGLVTKAILGTGTAILLFLATGALAGLLRYGIIQRFPRVLRKSDTIRLDLRD